MRHLIDTLVFMKMLNNSYGPFSNIKTKFIYPNTAVNKLSSKFNNTSKKMNNFPRELMQLMIVITNVSLPALEPNTSYITVEVGKNLQPRAIGRYSLQPI